MIVTASIGPARLLEEQPAQAGPDLLRELLTTSVNTLMSAEADAICGACEEPEKEPAAALDRVAVPAVVCFHFQVLLSA